MNLKNKTSKDFEIDGIINEMGLAARKAGRILAVSNSEDKKGVIVSKVNDENINLKKNDKILEINREVVNSTKTFISLVDKYEKTGRSSLLLKIERDNETSWVTIKFIN